MARIQVLTLAYPSDGEPPFVLVLDGLTEAEQAVLAEDFAGLKDVTGARAVLAFSFPVDVA